MFELLEKLCLTDGTSGDENAVRDVIISYIDGFCDWHIDNLGNMLVWVNGVRSSTNWFLDLSIRLAD